MSLNDPSKTGRLLGELLALFALPALIPICVSYFAPFVALGYWQWFLVNFTAQWFVRCSISGANVRTYVDND
jgi:hypothetical protein